MYSENSSTIVLRMQTFMTVNIFWDYAKLKASVNRNMVFYPLKI